MKNLLLIIFIFIIAAGCTNSPGKPEPPDRLPDDEVPAFRDAAIKIMPYLTVKDSAYHITISKEEALRIGIPEQYFNRMLKEIEYTNYLIREEYNKKGIPVEIPEYTVDTNYFQNSPGI